MAQTYDLVTAWTDNVAYSHSKTERTAEACRHNFSLFCQFINHTPEQIMHEYEQSSDRDFRRKFAQYVRSWISSMSHGPFTSGTMAWRVAAVRSFFTYNDLPLGHIPTGRVSVEYHNRDITKEEVMMILEGSRPREKAFYAVMAQSGLRPECICKLKLKNLEPDLSKGTVPCRIDVPKEITKGQYRSYFTFIGEDAIRYLKAWLSTRRNLTPESYLFTAYNSEQPLDRTSPSHRFAELAVKFKEAGTLEYGKKTKGKPSELRLYVLRKYFRKYANQAGFEFVQFWMGHIVNAGKEESYRPQDIEFHRKLYAEKAMPFLRLETSTPSETESVIAEQQAQIQKQSEEIAELKKQMETLTHLVELYSKAIHERKQQEPKE